ncbi:MAG: aldehyde dehydrogenase family protein, partial [Actinomycetes bacterium]
MTLQGTNSWILGIDGLVIVDPGPLDESHLLDVAMHGSIEHIFLTHGHGDHSDGAQRLHELTGAPVSAWDERHVSHGEKLTDSMTLQVAGLDIEILHAPGHTMDSVCFVVTSGSESVVLTGDTILGEGSAVIRRSPVGVLLGIMPWNYPYYQVARFAGPNLTLGNTIVLKHAPQCPESAEAIAQIFDDAGFPRGAYVNVYATNEQIAEAIADPLVQGVSLTGSERAGA